MTQIADVYARLLLDDKEAKKTLTQDLPAEAEKGGQKAGRSFGGAMGTAVRATVGGIAGGLFGGIMGMAGKATTELNTAMANFAADTNATQEEMASAQKTIANLYRQNLQGFGEIGDALGKMRTDLGMTQEEADAAAQSFLSFATATRQNAGDAVMAFDDILDNWGLTAKDSQRIMDSLIVSHQKFGGSIADNQRTLAQLAPAMRAANFSIDDGISLLGLFGAKGLDAQMASAAFAKALTKVKSPQELQVLIQQIQNTEDPFRRASLAADLFGARAGAKLANALGGANLDDYIISVEESAGASQRAADAINGSFGNQFQLMLKNAGGALADFGSQFGPLLMVAGQFGPSLMAKIGGGLGALTGALSTRLFSIGRTAGLRLAAGLASTAVVQAISTNLQGAFDKVSTKLQPATDKLGGSLGSKLGKAAGVAFAAVMVVEVWNTYNDQKAQLDSMSSDIGKSVGEQIVTGTTDQLKQSKGALEDGIKQLGDLWWNPFSGDQKANLQKELDKVNAELARRAAAGGVTVGTEAGKGVVQGVQTGVQQAAPVLQVEADKVMETFGTGMAGVKAAMSRTGFEGMTALAQGISQARQQPLDAFNTLKDMLKNAMTPQQEQLRLHGQLLSKTLAQGLRSGDPVVRAQAQATAQAITQRLAELSQQGGKAGREAGKALADALRSKNPEIRAAAQAAKAAMDAKLQAAKASASAAGSAAGSAFSTGVRSGVGTGGWTFNGSFAFRGGVRALAKGDWNVARDQMAQIHKGEMVVPARPAALLRAGDTSPIPSAGERSGGHVFNVYNPAPEPASTSISRELRKLAYMGVVS